MFDDGDYDYPSSPIILALPGSIMRNFRGLADEYNNYKIEKDVEENIDEIVKGSDGNWQPSPTAYHFKHKTKTDYKLSKGFIKWLHNEHRKVRGLSD
jgi:hypothetical protein